jgi:hypothetical protein
MKYRKGDVVYFRGVVVSANSVTISVFWFFLGNTCILTRDDLAYLPGFGVVK